MAIAVSGMFLGLGTNALNKSKKQQKGIINKTTFNDDDDFKANTFFNSRFLFKERGSDMHDNLFD